MSLVLALGFGLLGAGTGALRVPAGPAGWGLVAAILVIPTLVAVPALYAAIRRIGAARTGVLVTTEPLWTVLPANAFLREPLRPGLLVGGGPTVAGALLAQVRAGRHKLAAGRLEWRRGSEPLRGALPGCF